MAFRERDLHKDEARIVLDKLLELETVPLYTQNSDAFQAEKIKWLQIYNQPYITRSLVEARTYPYSVPQPLRARLSSIHPFPSMSFPHIQDNSPTSSSPGDEIGVMADVQAYFQIAYRVSSLF